MFHMCIGYFWHTAVISPKSYHERAYGPLSSDPSIGPD